MLDCAGFAVRHSYSTNTAVGRVRSQDGAPTVTCVIQFIVVPPKSGAKISRVIVHAFPFDRWQRWDVPPWLPRYDFSNADCPSPDSVADYQKAPRPLDLNFVTDFIYDTAEDQVYDDSGPVSGSQILDFAYEYTAELCGAAFVSSTGSNKDSRPSPSDLYGAARQLSCGFCARDMKLGLLATICVEAHFTNSGSESSPGQLKRRRRTSSASSRPEEVYSPTCSSSHWRASPGTISCLVSAFYGRSMATRR